VSGKEGAARPQPDPASDDAAPIEGQHSAAAAGVAAAAEASAAARPGVAGALGAAPTLSGKAPTPSVDPPPDPRAASATASPERAPADTETGIDLGRRLAAGTLLAGRYRVISALGLGGMGVVYKAHDEELGTDVAVKVLRPDLGSDGRWLERFRRELVLARQVTHRNVVRIHDIGESEGLRFLTMSYVEGRSLLAVLQDGPLPLERALGIVVQLAEALQHAPDAGVVHRDLKPANVLLRGGETPVLLDFGLAHLAEATRLTQEGEVMGTPNYMAPEQILGEGPDPRSDLYSAGGILYEAACGEPPFRAERLPALCRMVVENEPQGLRARGADVPEELEALVLRLLAKDPGARGDAAGAARALAGMCAAPPTA
jgi:serine/threonine-protein kinase